MLIMWLCQALFGAAALVFCAMTCHAYLRGDKRAHFFLTLAGAISLIFFVSLPNLPVEMIAVSLLTIAAGVIMTPPAERAGRVSFESTATRRRR
jgi:hypothetical protein